MSVALLEKKIESDLIDGQFFPARPDLMAGLRFPRDDELLGHGWLEYCGMEVSAEEVSDIQNRDIGGFICQLIELLEGSPVI